MDRWGGRVALVTGASTGIGAAICRELVKHGMTVIGCARNDKQIESLSGELADLPGKLHAFHCDLTRSEQIEALFGSVREQFGGVDVCVNNAGVSFAEPLLDGDVGKWRTILDVNVLAVAHCSQLAVRSMRDRQVSEGQVITLNSLSGHRVLPSANIHFYSLSKHAVTALTEGLRQELAASQPNNIRVAQISPGMVRTEFASRAHGDAEPSVERLKDGIEPSAVANAVVWILSNPPDVQISDILLRPTTQQF